MPYASGEISAKIYFHDLWVEDDSEGSILDAVFPDGYEGELDVMHTDVDIEDDEDEQDGDY